MKILNLREFFKKEGYSCPDESFYTKMNVWDGWYKGKSDDFHKYTQYNGIEKISRERLSLGLAKKLCEDKADLLLNETVDINLADENTRNYVESVLFDNNFRVMANRLIEITSALGTGAFVEFVANNTVYIDTVEGKNIYPLSWDNERITECAFVSTIHFFGVECVYINMHLLEKGEYVIKNRVVFDGSNQSTSLLENILFAGHQSKRVNGEAQALLTKLLHQKLSALTQKDEGAQNPGLLPQGDTGLPGLNLALLRSHPEIEQEILGELLGFAPEIRSGSTVPFFQIIKPNTVNNFDRSAPLGISVFAGAIDILKAIDIIYDSYINEFTLGKKRIFIDASLMQVAIGKNNSKPVPVFDTNDVAFYGLSGLREKNEMLREVNMTLRVNEHINALNNNLSLLGAKCGFGQKYYSFEDDGVKTATEVISDNSDLFRKIKKEEILLEKAIIDMVKAILYLGSTFLGHDLDVHGEVTVNFDDSIMEDSGEKRRQALIEYNAGIIDDVEYFMQTRSMNEVQAVAYAAGIRARGVAAV